MTRIKCTKIQYGESFVLPIESEDDRFNSSKMREGMSALEKEIQQAELKKQELINEGQREAENLIIQVKAQIEAEQQEIARQREEEQQRLEVEVAQIKEDAYKTGYDDGNKQGYEDITKELEDKILAVDTFASSQFELKNNIIKSSELDIINLVIEIAQKVCTKSLELNPDLIRVITLNAIKSLKDKEEIKIIINPKLTEIINSISDKLMEELPQLKTIRIIEENNVSADGTIVESLLTRVDSRVKAQINEIADKLMSGYNSDDSEDLEILEEAIPLEEHPALEDFSEIQLSDDANIMEFLDELEEIPLIEDKVRDEDAKYYENIDLSELKDENENSKAEEKSLDDINVDVYDDIGVEEIEEIEDVSNMKDVQDVDIFKDLDISNIENVDLTEDKNV